MKAWMQGDRGVIAVLLSVAYFSLVYWFVFSGSALGMAPQLDSRELLGLSFDLSNGTLAGEPFYRAMGYPLILSVFARCGLGYGQVISVALLMGVVLHLLNTAMVMRLSALVWENKRSTVISGLLFGLNPVVVFFTIDVLDIGLGLSCSLGGLNLILGDRGRKGWKGICIGGLLLGFSFVVRPHFIFLLPAVLLVKIFKDKEASGVKVGGVVLLLAMIIPMFLQAMMGYQQSGDWRWMPWQGAYNLYAANERGANGKYFKQKYVVSDRLDRVNPARAEAEVRYGIERSKERPYTINEMNEYWRTGFIETVFNEPVEWLKLLSRKFYYSLNNFEQYNNKTYSFYAEGNRLLKWNPISFGWIFVLGIGGVLVGWNGRNKRRVMVLIGVGACYGVSLILFYASARFRVPLHGLLAILAGGMVTEGWRVFRGTDGVKRLGLSGMIVLLAGVITFSSFLGVDDTSTYIQDRMLLAGAGLESGDDVLAAEMAQEVLKENPARLDARRVYLIAYFNLMTGAEEEGRREYGDWDAQLPEIEGYRFDEGDFQMEMILGLIYWHSGFSEKAVEKWEKSLALGGTERAFVAEGLLTIVKGEPKADGRGSGIRKELEQLLER